MNTNELNSYLLEVLCSASVSLPINELSVEFKISVVNIIKEDIAAVTTYVGRSVRLIRSPQSTPVKPCEQ